MTLKCERCGHIHWKEVPALRETFETIKAANNHYYKENGTPLRFTSTAVKNTFGISKQNACNRLRKLEQLNVISKVDIRHQESGGRQKRVPTR